MFPHKLADTAAEILWGRLGSLNEFAGVTAALSPTHFFISLAFPHAMAQVVFVGDGQSPVKIFEVANAKRLPTSHTQSINGFMLKQRGPFTTCLFSPLFTCLFTLISNIALSHCVPE